MLWFLLLFCVSRIVLAQPRINPIVSHRVASEISRLPPKGAPHDFMPIKTSGSCQKGVRYRIDSVEDLRYAIDEVECIFWSGATPNRIPLGMMYGNVLQVLNSNLFDPLVRALWKGKMGVMAKCRSRPDFHTSWNFVGPSLRIPAGLTIGKCPLSLGPGEYTDDQPHFMIDYTADFAKLCPYDSDFLFQSDLGVVNNVYPFNQIVDVVRVVGREVDGGLIYLGKTYLKDPWRPEYEAVTVAYWYVVNYDDEVLPDFRHGDVLPPLKESFSFYFPGAVEFGIGKIVPIIPALTRPIETMETFYNYVIRWPLGAVPDFDRKHPQKNVPRAFKLLEGVKSEDGVERTDQEWMEEQQVIREALREAVKISGTHASGSQFSESAHSRLMQLQEISQSMFGLQDIDDLDKSLVAAAMTIYQSTKTEPLLMDINDVVGSIGTSGFSTTTQWSNENQYSSGERHSYEPPRYRGDRDYVDQFSESAQRTNGQRYGYEHEGSAGPNEHDTSYPGGAQHDHDQHHSSFNVSESQRQTGHNQHEATSNVYRYPWYNYVGGERRNGTGMMRRSLSEGVSNTLSR